MHMARLRIVVASMNMVLGDCERWWGAEYLPRGWNINHWQCRDQRSSVRRQCKASEGSERSAILFHLEALKRMALRSLPSEALHCRRTEDLWSRHCQWMMFHPRGRYSAPHHLSQSPRTIFMLATTMRSRAMCISTCGLIYRQAQSNP